MGMVLAKLAHTHYTTKQSFCQTFAVKFKALCLFAVAHIRYFKRKVRF